MQRFKNQLVGPLSLILLLGALALAGPRASEAQQSGGLNDLSATYSVDSSSSVSGNTPDDIIGL